MAVREEYRRIVMDTFHQSNSRPGHVMPMRNFRFGVMRDMTREQQDDFIDSINSLIQDGYITYADGRPGLDVLRLTQSGYDVLYDTPDRLAIAEKIMEQFREQH